MKRKMSKVAKLILEIRKNYQIIWPHLSKRVSLKNANKFFLGAIIDYQINADKAWENARRLAEDELGDPDKLWSQIIKISLKKWMSKFRKYKLHRFPKAHERVWTIGK